MHARILTCTPAHWARNICTCKLVISHPPTLCLIPVVSLCSQEPEAATDSEVSTVVCPPRPPSVQPYPPPREVRGIEETCLPSKHAHMSPTRFIRFKSGPTSPLAKRWLQKRPSELRARRHTPSTTSEERRPRCRLPSAWFGTNRTLRKIQGLQMPTQPQAGIVKGTKPNNNIKIQPS